MQSQETSSTDKDALDSKASSKREPIKGVIDFVSGSVAGFIGKIIEYPFDTIKVRLQVQSGFKSPLDCFKKSIEADGYRFLYRGISAPIVGSMLENSFMFMSYKQSQNFISHFTKDYSELRYLVLAGAMSGFCTSAVLTPVELIKCQIQVNQNSRKSPLSLFVSVIKENGIRGIYKGHLGTSFREVGGNACWFGAYEISRSTFQRYLPQHDVARKRSELPSYAILASGALAGVSYNFSFYPIDVLKSNMQTNRSDAKSTYVQLAKEIYKKHGSKGFYRGCGITLFRALPSNAVIFYTYELCSSRMSNALL